MYNPSDAAIRAVQDGFGARRALVVGDLILDRYVWGEVSRISPEAPVPVVRTLRMTEAAGGAANVALNLTGLGLEVSVVGIAGEDVEATVLRGLLETHGVDASPIVAVPGRPTTAKTRVLGGRQQMLRLDVEDTSALGEVQAHALLDQIEQHLSRGVDVIVLSDYAKGVLGDGVCEKAIRMARRCGVPVLVDPKGQDFRKYAGATALTPNRSELATASGADARDWSRLARAGMSFCTELAFSFMVVTRGEEGISLFHSGAEQHFPAITQEVFDVSGAGDTVISVLAAGLAAKMDLADALCLGNLAAGVVISKVGTVPITRRELEGALGLLLGRASNAEGTHPLGESQVEGGVAAGVPVYRSA